MQTVEIKCEYLEDKFNFLKFQQKYNKRIGKKEEDRSNFLKTHPEIRQDSFVNPK